MLVRESNGNGAIWRITWNVTGTRFAGLCLICLCFVLSPRMTISAAIFSYIAHTQCWSSRNHCYLIFCRERRWRGSRRRRRRRSERIDMSHVEEFVRLFGPCVNPFNGLLNVFYGQQTLSCFMATQFSLPLALSLSLSLSLCLWACRSLR